MAFHETYATLNQNDETMQTSTISRQNTTPLPVSSHIRTHEVHMRFYNEIITSKYLSSPEEKDLSDTTFLRSLNIFTSLQRVVVFQSLQTFGLAM